MYHKIIFFNIFILLFLLCSCGKKGSNDEILQSAYEKSDEFATASLEILSQISLPNELNKAQKAKYNLLQAKANLRVGKKVAYDSLLNHSISYYKNERDTALLYESYYFLAMGKYVDKDYIASLEIMDQGEKYLPFINDIIDYGLIANLRMNSLLRLNRITEAKNVADYILQHADINGAKYGDIVGWLMHATIDNYNEKTLESERNYLKALQFAKDANHFGYKRVTLNRLAALMQKEGKYDKSLIYLNQVSDLIMSRKNVPQVNLMKAVLFYKKNQLDSAYHYAEIASQGDDPFVAKIAASHISQWLAFEGDYFGAYNKKSTEIYIADLIESKINFSASAEAFREKELENENNLLKIKEQKRTLLFLITIFMLLSSEGFMYLFFYRKQRKEREVHLKMKATKLEQDNLLLKQLKQISELREKEASMRESLFRRINVLKKLPSITEIQSDEPNSSQKISLSDEDWNELIQTIDDAYPNYTQRLKVSFPSLTMDDICFCCFLKIKVNLQDLSDIYCVSKTSITKKKYRIKIDKLHLTDKQVNLDDFLKLF